MDHGQADLVVHRNANIRDLAIEFCKKHGLSDDKVDALVDHINDNLAQNQAEEAKASSKETVAKANDGAKKKATGGPKVRTRPSTARAPKAEEAKAPRPATARAADGNKSSVFDRLVADASEKVKQLQLEKDKEDQKAKEQAKRKERRSTDPTASKDNIGAKMYENALKHKKAREEELAKKKEEIEKERADGGSFKPNISSYARSSATSAQTWDRLLKDNPKARALAKAQEKEKAVPENEAPECKFSPAINPASAAIASQKKGESEDGPYSRLYKEAQDRAQRRNAMQRKSMTISTTDLHNALQRGAPPASAETPTSARPSTAATLSKSALNFLARLEQQQKAKKEEEEREETKKEAKARRRTVEPAEGGEPKALKRSDQLVEEAKKRRLKSIWETVDKDKAGSVSVAAAQSCSGLSAEDSELLRAAIARHTAAHKAEANAEANAEAPEELAPEELPPLSEEALTALMDKELQQRRRTMSMSLTARPSSSRLSLNAWKEKEETELTFKPHIDQHSSRLANRDGTSVFEHLHSRGEHMAKKKEQLKQEIDGARLAECTFAPELVTKVKPVKIKKDVKVREARRVSLSYARENNGNDSQPTSPEKSPSKQQAKSPLASGTSTPPQTSEDKPAEQPQEPEAAPAEQS